MRNATSPEDEIGRAALWGGPPGRAALLGAACLLALPGVMAAVAAVRYGWQPVADDGTILTRAHDVLTTRSPPLGQYSLVSAPGAPPTHSPGPLLYWLLAVPVRLGPVAVVPITMALVNTACMIGTALLASRWGRIPLAAATVGLLVLVRAWGGYQLYAPWNPSAALLPFVALVAVTGAVACGSHRLLPVVAVLASFCVQLHLTFLVPAAWVSAVAVVAVAGPPVLDLLRRRPPAPDRRGRIRSLALATAVSLVCWAAPLVQQVRGDPGNLALLLRSWREGSDTIGPRRGANSVIRLLTGPPVWLRAEGTSLTGFFKLDLAVSGAVQAAAVGLVAALVVLTVRAARRGDRPLVALGILTSGLLLAGWVVASAIPKERVVILGYSLWWLSAVGILTWLAVLLGLAREAVLLGRRRRPAVAEGRVDGEEDVPDRPATTSGPGIRPGPRWVAVGAGLVLAVLVAVTLPMDEDVVWAYDPARQLGDAAVAAAEPGQLYLVSFGTLHIDLAPPVGYRLRQAGAEPVLPQSLGPATGRGYAPRGERCDGIFRLIPVSEAAEPDRPAGEVTIRELDIPVPHRPRTRYVLTLSEDERRSC